MFQEKWSWYISLNMLCGNDLNLIEQWLDSNILEFLNQLSFLNEKYNIQK